tara:strand:- start:1345 stop:1902 length:558 start_codon:yes stop_codon:yes gene_type:complete
MAHFAKLDEDNIVTQVVVISNEDILDSDGNESEEVGVQFCHSLFGDDTIWKQTSYNTRGGNVCDSTDPSIIIDGTSLRKNYAGIGDTYDAGRDAFYTPKPFPSWILNEDTCYWEAPVAYPDDDKYYEWNEAITNWDIPPQPYASWTLDDNNNWQAPVTYPDDGKAYTWDEDTTNWVEAEFIPLAP